MEKVKQQKIVVLLSFGKYDKNLILNGIKVASVLRKELCLIYNYSKKDKKNLNEIEGKLHQYTLPIKNELQGFKVSTELVSEKLRDLPDKLADDLEGICIIAAKSAFKKYSKSVSESPVPFLFVNEESEHISNFQKIILPIDLRSENSETALWASYFGRFNKAGIVVVAANDKGKEGKKQVNKNVVLTRKLFQKFIIENKIFKGTKSSFGNAFEGLEIAQSSKSDLLIILGSSAITPLDWLIGLPERKIIEKAGDLPILIINPRKDNYILCD